MNELAKLQVRQESMPLDRRDRESVIAWLRQIAGEIERGEHFDTSMFTLGQHRRSVR